MQSTRRTAFTHPAAVARPLTSLTLTAASHAESEIEVRWAGYGEAYRASLQFHGQVYSGWSDTEGVAKRKVFENVAGLNGMLVSDVMSEFYGDFEDAITL